MPAKKKDAQKQKQSPTAQMTEDELLEAAIAESRAARAIAPPTASAGQPKAQGRRKQRDEQPSSAPSPKPAALTREAIVRKLNDVPAFAILNADSDVVSMESDSGNEVVCWFIDAAEVEALLAATKAQNPESAGLHMGCVPLGAAYALVAGWQSSGFSGELRLQGTRHGRETTAAQLREQAASQGLPPSTWNCPVFVCHALESPTLLPVFFSYEDMLSFWVATGRPRKDAPEQVAVVDLNVLVAQMQTDAFAWRTLHFVGSHRAAELVAASKAERALLEPPPLTSDAPPVQAEAASEASTEDTTDAGESVGGDSAEDGEGGALPPSSPASVATLQLPGKKKKKKKKSREQQADRVRSELAAIAIGDEGIPEVD